MNKLTITRSATLTGYFGLLVLIIYWAINPSLLDASSTSVILFFGGLPLLFGLPGILKQKPYTHAWISMISLLYLIHGIIEVWSQPDNLVLASVEIFLSILLYLGAGFYARYRSRELREISTNHL